MSNQSYYKHPAAMSSRRQAAPPSSYSFRKTLQEQIHAKTCYFYKDGDYRFSGVKIAVHPKRYRRLDNLCAELSGKITGLPYGVRSIRTPRGRDVIRSVDGLEDEGHYICSTFRHRAEGLDVSRVVPPARWHYNKPNSGQRDLNAMLHDPDLDTDEDLPRVKRARYEREQRMSYAYNHSLPKKITVLRNGEPSQRHILLINRRTAQTYDQILRDLSEMFQSAVRKLYTIEGRKILSLTQLFNGPEVLVATGKEPFKSMLGSSEPLPHPHPAPISSRSHLTPRYDFPAEKLKNRRDRLMRTRGNWRVWVTTNELASAGTTAQVTLTVYGHKGQTSPLPLGLANGQQFQNGYIDEFDVSVGGIGEIYKVRVGHDNTGDFPAWLCDEVRMRDRDTGEELVFPVKRWMSRDEDDREICREIPVTRRGEPNLPVIRYKVSVVTGNLWNAGTTANVYLTLYGDRGDSGVRQLYSPNKTLIFRKGQTDHFTVEAVSLGKLRRAIIGHDGTNPGEGWYLEKISVQEPDAKPHEVYTFYCNKWLDEGEDDGKIVREIRVQDDYMDDLLAKRNWEFDKWKFDSKNQVMLFSLVTGKALRIKSDGTVDGLGEETDPGTIFTVSSRKPMVRIFTSLLNQNFHLAIDNGKILGHGRGGPYCEFRIHVQSDSTVMLEGVKSPLQFISLLDSGKLGDPRGLMDREPGKRFHVYCKGMFRHRGIVMLKTSSTQAVNVDHDLSVYGTGKCHRGAHFRVHKTEPGVRLFESMVHQGKFLRLHDGKIDCQGGREEASHFMLHKQRDKGYVRLQSKLQRGIFLGLTPKGEVRPTVDTGVSNVWLFPEVIEFGVSKHNLSDSKLAPITETELDSRPSPQPKTQEPAQPAEGEWRVEVDTLENLEHGQVALVVYGDRGQSKPIMLTPPVANGPAFRAGGSDQFKAILHEVGEIYKIRLELSGQGSGRSPTWKVGQLTMTELASRRELTFRFMRWLSRQQDDGDIARELPVVKKGKEVLPVRKYEVRVYTGREEGADTKASVYVNLFGEHGDCGKRFLLKSNNRTPFAKGQCDRFEVEAVHLGELSRCLVGHGATRTGEGWFLDSIVVQETHSNGRQFVFPCNRWLDAGREDRKIERLLPVKEGGHFTPPPEEEVLPVARERTPTPLPEEEKEERGSWRLLLYTGGEGNVKCSDCVALYAYGDRGCVGPISLDNGQTTQLSPGSTDEFKINIDEDQTGQLYKIRVGMTERTFGAQWFLDKVIMVRYADGETLEFKVGRWMSRFHDDCDVWRELPVVRPGETPLPVHLYELQVHTGDEPGAETEAAVFVTLFGERGDTGRRRLYKTKSGGKLFSRGKRDVFVVEAVSVGRVLRVVVGHQEAGRGEGWYLSHLALSDLSQPHSPPTFFPCNRWLDSGKEDGRLEVELLPGDPPASSQGEYQLWVKTAPDSSPANGGKVSIAVYGSQGQTKDVKLSAPNNRARLFEPGNIDEFEVALGSIGEVQKLRVHREDSTAWKAWHLQEVKMTDKATKRTLTFVFDRWFSRDMDDHDLVRELPALKDNKPISEVCKYEVMTFTGDHWAGGTDASVHITITGTKGDCGKRLLYTPPGSYNTFRNGQEDTFQLEAVDLGALTSVVIGHDGRGHGAGWFLDKVVIKVKGGGGGRFVFPCLRWLDAGEDDGKTERELRQIDMPDLWQIAPMSSRKESTGDWEVTVRTSDLDQAGTCAQVYLTVYGSKGISPLLSLGHGSPTSNEFWRGKETKFKVKVGQVGSVSKVRVEHDNTNPEPAWHLDWVRMVDAATEEELFFPFNRWLAADKEDGQLHRECAVMSPGVPPVPVLHYLIGVQTGRKRTAGAKDGSVRVTLIGHHGDTGQQLLQRPLSSTADKMAAGKLDVYMLEAVSVGSLRSLKLAFEAKGQGKRWFVERVTVLESVGAIEEAVFNFHCWLDADGDNAKEVPLSDTIISSSITEDISYSLLESIPPESEGRWEVTVWTGSGGDAGTSQAVMMVLYGTTGQSEPKMLNAHAALNPGSVVKTTVEAGTIGPLFKLRLRFGDSSAASPWLMERLKLRDVDSGQEFHFDKPVRLESSPLNPYGSVELPAIRPDIAPLPDTTYLVTVTTGDAERAETDAEIFCTLIGQWGDSGERLLTRSKSHQKPFLRAQTDQFEVGTLYLGGVSKLLIGHNETGRGCGWLCSQVTVQPLDAPAHDTRPQTVFTCNKWLDSGCGDRRLVRELIPSGQILPSDSVLNQSPRGRSQKRGVWRCDVTMGTEDRLDAGQGAVSLPEEVWVVAYGARGAGRAVSLGSNKPDAFLLGQTDTFHDVDLGDLGELVKVRVCGGREDDENLVWMVHKVVLTDQGSGEVLRFDFGAWLGQKGRGVHRELPVLRAGQVAVPVVEYEVQVETEKGGHSGTNSSVSVNLYGTSGDCGSRRLLHSSTNRQPFQPGQVDVFIIEAVDLGDLEKVVVTKGPGHPWQLGQVKVRPGLFSSLSHVFLWNKPVGSPAQESREVEVTLPVVSSWPAPVAVPAAQAKDVPTSEGQWQVEIVSGRGALIGDVDDLVIVMCGDKGESTPIKFLSSRDRPFQARQVDTAQIHLAQDVGDLFKVRLGFDDNSRHKSLDIDSVKFEDVDTRDNFSYALKKEVEVSATKDGWLEFPVVWPAVHVLSVLAYKVEVMTGGVANGNTSAQVYIQLNGKMGSTGRRQLKKSLRYDNMFQLNQTDLFEIEAVDLMRVDSVVIGHHSSQPGLGWFLKKVTVTAPGEEPCVFHCNRWLDAGEDDRCIQRTLRLTDVPPPTPTRTMAPLVSARSPTPPPVRSKKHQWRVWTSTGSGVSQGTSCAALLVLYGTAGCTEPMLVGQPSSLTFRFTEGQTQHFQVESEVDVGELYKARVGLHGAGQEVTWYTAPSQAPHWLLEQLKVEEVSSGRQYVFDAHTWICADEQRDHWREFPVHTSPDRQLSVLQYVVDVWTGDKFGAGTDANVYLQIFGERGDTGKRHLHGTTTPGKMFEREMHDTFTVEAVDLGRLVKINVSHDGLGAGSGWFLDKVTVKASAESREKFIFVCDRWLDVHEEDGAIERDVRLTQVEKADIPGEWTVRIMTGSEDYSGTDARVFLTVFGELGHSDLLPLGSPEQNNFQTGHTDEFKIWLDPDKIGRIQKIRLQHDNTGMGPGWKVHKMTMTDKATGDQLTFMVDTWLSYSEEEGDVVFEAAAEWPGQDSLPKYRYMVKTVTPNESNAGTDADVYLTLVGSRGDSGRRQLKRSLEGQSPFQTGKTDSFAIHAVDLGTLERVVVGLNNPGYGSSWKLQCVMVRVADKESFVFPWGKWLDDRTPEVEVPLAEVVDDYSDPHDPSWT